ncbi:hypothetical protein HYU13_05880 [Candidatus Woesearchaeota archaeon]|nr:hypothetical protein [Candidatus Woesearchaeota archaeon]
MVSQPAKVDITLAMGVNHELYKPFDSIGNPYHVDIANASCTTKALATPIKALMNAGITFYAVLMDTAHAATNTQRVLQFADVYGVLDELQTAKTGAAIATAELIPVLEHLMDGYAIRAPVKDGSFANIFSVVSADDSEKITVTGINKRLEEASRCPQTMGRLAYFRGMEAGTTDIVGNAASGIIVASKTKSIKLPFPDSNGRPTALIGICSGYDNELGPSRDLAMLVGDIARKTF